MDALVAAATVVIVMGSSAIGSLGTIAELGAKGINKNQYPLIRSIGEVFAKTLQSASAAFSLLIIGSLFANPVGVTLIGSLGVIMLLTPTINAITQHQGTASLKRAFALGDRIVSMTSKVVNTALLTAGFFMALGVPAGIIGGISFTALSIVTYQKS